MTEEAGGGGGIGNLLTRLDGGDLGEARDAQDELTVILEAGAAVDLSAAELAELNRLLGYSVRTSWPVFRDVRFVVAVIGALGGVGDDVSLRLVTKLAAECRQPEVRVAARECRPILERRLRDLPSRHLLRPSDAMSEMRRKLVRTARPPDAGELLRAEADGDSSGSVG